MWLLKLPLMFVLRQSRWVVRLFAVGVAVLIFKLLGNTDVVSLPGMEHPYVIGTMDPYIASGVVYLIISRSLRKLTSGMVTTVGQGFDRLRPDD